MLISKKNKIEGRRYSETGYFGYRFKSGKDLICNIDCLVVPKYPLFITGFNEKWISDYDPEKTIIPGMIRNVYDHETNEILYKIKYINKNTYMINDTINVECGWNHYQFYQDNELILELDGIDTDAYIPSETYFDVTMHHDIDHKWLMLMLAFPMLRFAF